MLGSTREAGGRFVRVLGSTREAGGHFVRVLGSTREAGGRFVPPGYERVKGAGASRFSARAFGPP